MRSFFSRHRTATTLGLTAIGVIVVIWWLIFGLWRDILASQWKWLTQVFIGRGFFPDGWNILHMTPLAMLLVAVVLWIVWLSRRYQRNTSASYYQPWREKIQKKSPDNLGRRKVLINNGLLVGAITMSILFCTFTWSGTNDKASSYASATTFVVADTDNMPSSLKKLADGASSTKDCVLLADHGMPACIVEGDLIDDWETRSASATGAETVLSRTSGVAANTTLMKSTLTYLYGEEGEGQWTAIRNGKNKQPLYGVVSWPGHGSVQQCKYTDSYSINMAFGGINGQNLTNEIDGRFPELFYDQVDIWGYCDDGKPVIVIPVTDQINFAHRTTLRSAGVLVIKGTPSGEPAIQHVTDVEPGDFPGPVYPPSLVDNQREQVKMMAGRINAWFRKFGYETLEVQTQEGNNSNYLLRSKSDKRLYWVTPMRPRSSDSQLTMAYSITPADEATSGALNEHKLYVLNDDDPRVVNLDDLEARTKEALVRTDGAFIPNGGKLVEFLPVDGNMWQVYGELNGRVVYRISVPADANVTPKVVALESGDGSVPTPDPNTDPGSTPPSSDCGGDPTRLSDKDLAQCLVDLSAELRRRQGE